MRRILVLFVVLLMLPCGLFCAAQSLSAYDLALQMAEVIDEMADIRKMPLEDAPDRVIWTDARTDTRCDLVVYASAEEAEKAAVRAGTRSTSARVVDCCLLGIDSDLSMEIIDFYQQCLADVLGVEAEMEEPDYILNVNTKIFHLPSCSSVGEMKETNRLGYGGDRDYLLEQGYEACKRCHP